MKKKGSRTERELLHMLYKENWAVVRSAGSGRITIPNPDLIASNGSRILAIECKSGKKDKRYITEEQIKELKEFSGKFGAEAWIGVRFDNLEWFFLKDKDLEKSKGNTFVIDKKLIENKGITFKKLIEN